MTATEFEYKWTNGNDGHFAGDARRFQVARVAHAVKNRMLEGMTADKARERVLEEPYYREDLAAGFDPLDTDGSLLKDFNSIDAP